MFYAFDAHGSVVQRLSGTGSVLSTQTFDAYGSRLSTDGNADPYAGYGGQSGYYTDWETGNASSALELLSLRYYDPSAGRFLTRDPIGYKGGANQYEYVSDDPTNGSDPSGLHAIGPIGGPIGGCVGAILGNQAGDDSCNSDYNDCLQRGDCAADAISSVLGYGFAAAITEAAPPAILEYKIIAGCIEGFISALLHMLVESQCRKNFDPCTPQDSPLCKFISGLIDTVAGCFDGLLGNLLEGAGATELEKQVADGLYEAITAFASNGYESSSCVGAG